MTEKLILAAAKTVLDGGGAHPMTLWEAKEAADLGNYYTELMVAPRAGGAMRLGVWIGTNGFRISTRALGLSEDAAYDMRSRARTALEYANLPVDDGFTTPVMFETADDIEEENDGWWSGLTTWTCTL